MTLKSAYLIDRRRWLPISRAAELLSTNAATVKRMMGDGRLPWHQVPRGKTLLVEEAAVLRLRFERGAGERDRAKRAVAATRTAAERGRSMRDVLPASVRLAPARGPTLWEPTWDPRAEVPAVPGREPGADEEG